MLLNPKGCTTETLQSTCYPYDYLTITEDGKLFDGSSRFRVARTRLNVALFLCGNTERITVDAEVVFTRTLFSDDISGLDRLLANGFDPNRRSSTGDTPFIAAARLAKTDRFLMKLIEHGADLESRVETNGQTALIVVSQHGIAKRVKLLLRLGANPNAVDDFGQTPLFVALVLDQKKYVPVVRELLAHGANPNVEGPRNPLMMAAGNAHPGCVAALIAAQADVNSVQDSELPSLRLYSVAGTKALNCCWRRGRPNALRAGRL